MRVSIHKFVYFGGFWFVCVGLVAKWLCVCVCVLCVGVWVERICNGVPSMTVHEVTYMDNILFKRCVLGGLAGSTIVPSTNSVPA